MRNKFLLFTSPQICDVWLQEPKWTKASAMLMDAEMVPTFIVVIDGDDDDDDDRVDI